MVNTSISPRQTQEQAASRLSNAAPETNEFWLDIDRTSRIQSRVTHPICLTRGSGARLWDVEDRRYLDFEAGQICASVGHSHPDYIAAVKAQLDRLVQTGSCYIADIQVEFQRKLSEITGGSFRQSFLACSGSEANEAAIRLAKIQTGRSEIVSLLGNYHGHTLASWSVTGYGGAARKGYGLGMPGVTFIPTPFDYPVPNQPRFPDRDPELINACVRYCRKMLDSTTTGEPAAVIVELIQSAAGVRTLPSNSLRQSEPFATSARR